MQPSHYSSYSELQIDIDVIYLLWKDPFSFELMKPWGECTCKHWNKNWSRKFPEVHGICWWPHKSLGTTLVVNCGNLSWKRGRVALHSRIQTITDPGVQFLLYSQYQMYFASRLNLHLCLWVFLCDTILFFILFTMYSYSGALFYVKMDLIALDITKILFFFSIFNFFWVSSL